MSPDRPPPGPSPDIVDAGHGTEAPGFYFLPPMADDPSPTGPFDDGLAPVVTICEGAVTECQSPVVEFTTTSGPGSETVRVVAEDEHYIVNWNTEALGLDPELTYRIVVSVVPSGASEALVLGYADVDLVATAADRNEVDTDAFVPLVDGATLPIKFRIETGIVGRMAVDPSQAEIGVGDTQSFTATLYDLHGTTLTGPTVSWSSDDEAVATMDGSGLATGESAGTATITATSQRVSDSAQLTVTAAAADPGALDLNGDGLADFIARGKPQRFGFTPDAFVHLNEGSGLETTASTTISAPSFAGFASSGWNPGDLDGDGHGDVIIAAENAGAVYIYRGTSTGAETAPDQTIASPSGKVGCSSFAGAGYYFGASVGTGDVNGDGVDDLVVGALEFLYVFAGASGGFSSTPDQFRTGPFFSMTAQSGFGRVLAVGDFDGDGIDDVAMGAERGAGSFRGQVYIYQGTSTGLSSGNVISPPFSECSSLLCGFGASVAADDFDGDGIDDLAVGAPGGHFFGGVVFLYSGSSSGLASTPTATVVGSNQMGERLSPLGDFDGDGDADLAASGIGTDVTILGGGPSGLGVVGSVQGPGAFSLFGELHVQSILGTGDVNGDGLTDLAVSQYEFDADGDFIREGALWIYHGTSSPSGATPDLKLRPSGTFLYGVLNGLGYNPVLARSP